jgi:hypothetical protein
MNTKANFKISEFLFVTQIFSADNEKIEGALTSGIKKHLIGLSHTH